MEILEIFKVLSDKNRLRILNLLHQYQPCVCEIETLLCLNQANVSRHLSKLKGAKIISDHKDAQWIHYSITDEFIEDEKDLFEYLKSKFTTLNDCLEDNKRLKNYLENGLTCIDIKNNRDKVNSYLAVSNNEK